jgi:hypothetical protein
MDGGGSLPLRIRDLDNDLGAGQRRLGTVLALGGCFPA